jgi:hypothetical protein
MPVEVLGIEETNAAIARAVAAANADATRNAAASIVVEAARQVGPDRTGALSASYEPLMGGVTTLIDYGPMVEFGTVYMPAQRRIWRAWQERLPEVEALMDAAIDEQGDREGL